MSQKGFYKCAGIRCNVCKYKLTQCVKCHRKSRGVINKCKQWQRGSQDEAWPGDTRWVALSPPHMNCYWHPIIYFGFGNFGFGNLCLVVSLCSFVLWYSSVGSFLLFFWFIHCWTYTTDLYTWYLLYQTIRYLDRRI